LIYYGINPTLLCVFGKTRFQKTAQQTDEKKPETPPMFQVFCGPARRDLLLKN
jgi:hypothetical protein